MAKYHAILPDSYAMIPVQFTTPEFNSFDYVQERAWIWQNGVPVAVPYYLRLADWESRNRQLAAQLVIWVAESISWTPETGFEMVVDTDHMYIDPVDDAWIRDDIPWDQQNPIQANSLTREVFFAAWRMLGWQINQID
jgi:hypothetical protein